MLDAGADRAGGDERERERHRARAPAEGCRSTSSQARRRSRSVSGAAGLCDDGDGSCGDEDDFDCVREAANTFCVREPVPDLLRHDLALSSLNAGAASLR